MTKHSIWSGPRPLSAHAYAELIEMASAPVPCFSMNPGVRRKLTQEGLAEIVQLTSPFRAHKGARCAHMDITQAGLDRLNELWPIWTGERR
jgi:hypothetical protein